MTEQVAIYIITLLAFAYVAYRLYGSIKKKKACDKCALMEATKKMNT